jgi:hypothetical protein
MRVATCVVCGERLNVLQEKLITAEWVDGTSGALLQMQFHSSCFVRWYQTTASARAGSAGGASGAPGAGDDPGATDAAPARPVASGAPPPPALPAPAPPPPDAYLSPAEQARLKELRGRLAGSGEAGEATRSTNAPGAAGTTPAPPAPGETSGAAQTPGPSDETGRAKHAEIDEDAVRGDDQPPHE